MKARLKGGKRTGLERPISPFLASFAIAFLIQRIADIEIPVNFPITRRTKQDVEEG